MIVKQKDFMYHFQSITEAIQIFIALVCFIGFVVGMLFVFIAIPMMWNKPMSYQPFPWLNYVLAWSICPGLVNFVFLISREKEWRRDYRDEEDSDRFERGACD